MTRLIDRCLRGERLFDSIPCSYGRNVSILGAMGTDGVLETMTVQGNVDGAVFWVHITSKLSKGLSPLQARVRSQVLQYWPQNLEGYETMNMLRKEEVTVVSKGDVQALIELNEWGCCSREEISQEDLCLLRFCNATTSSIP